MVDARRFPYRSNLKTPPASEPLTLSEVKEYLGITDSASDNILTSWITSVRQAVELYTGLALINRS